MTVRKLDPSKLSNFYQRYLRFVGLWKPSKKSKLSDIYTIYGLTFLFMFSFLYTFCMTLKIFYITNVKDTTTVLFMSLNEVSLFIKVVYFYVQNRKIQKLLGELNNFDLYNDDEQQLINDRINFFWKLNLFYYIIANWATSSTEIAALFANETMLPFTGVYPGLDWQHNRRDYWIVYFYQCAGMLFTCNMSMSVDMYPCFFIYMISIELRVLGRRMRALGYVNDNNEKNGKTMNMEERKKYEINAIKDLIDCIKKHQTILQQSDIFERLFTMAFLSLIAISGIVICSMSNELSRVSWFHCNMQISKFIVCLFN